ncbi:MULTISPECIES: hemerythrin domain-containing protein [Caldimonas]|uniref:hemerythrin domain-containing protein n=1 Tax=Caldimonas TaxID=196013 RepID=UPI000373440C|nr:hemerythrin domain-containing protein [Caldimonas manganoxidans]
MSELLQWSDALVLGNDAMDRTHEEFVQRLQALQAARDDALRPALRALIEHTEAHFGQEDAWMAATGFAPDNCHQRQHAMVLALMRQVEQQAAQDLSLVRRLADELATWFVQHAQMMDAALAWHCEQVGFDTATGTLRPTSAAQPVPDVPMSHCGSAGCGTR